MPMKNEKIRVPLAKPYVTRETRDEVWRVLDSGHLTEGTVTRQFEELCGGYIGCAYTIAVPNCTVGLETALRAASISAGDEVIVPDYTYPATAGAARIVGANVVLVDINPETMLIDYGALEQAVTPRTRAVIPVSLFGNPLDYERLDMIRKKHDILVVEDAACSLGACYDNTRVGNLADISVFSFHPRKSITTGEGGLITTNNEARAKWMRSYKHFGMEQHAERGSTSFSMPGTNYKFSDILAAVGLVQMRRIDEILDRRQALAERYVELLAGCAGITIPHVTPKGRHSWQSFCVLVERGRDRLIGSLRERGIQTQIGTYSLHAQPAFANDANCRTTGNMESSRYALDHCLTLPLYHEMTEDAQDSVVNELLSALEQHEADQGSDSCTS